MYSRGIILIYASISLFGCSTHPLQDTKTGFSLSEIILQIRCEAKEATSMLLIEHQLTDEKKKFNKINDAIKEKKKQLAPIIKENKSLLRDRQILATAKNILHEDLNILIATYDPQSAIWLKKNLNYQANKKAYYRNLDAYLVEFRQNAKKKYIIEASIEHLNSQIQDDKSLKKIVKFFGNTVASDFRFQITETNTAGVEGAYKFPIHLGLLTIGVQGSDEKERQSERNAKLTINFKELDEIPDSECANPTGETSFIQARHYPIRGKIGLHEVFREYLTLSNQEKGRLAKTAPYTDQIIFTTTIGGGINPSIVLKPVALEEVSASLDFTSERKDLHSVTINLTPPGEATDATITRVQIVTEPNLFLGGN